MMGKLHNEERLRQISENEIAQDKIGNERLARTNRF
jgi:hypothetical protein